MTTASVLRNDDNAIAPADLELACVTAPRSVVRMPIRTRETQRLLRGRPAADGKPAIIGLFGFAERVRIIWDAAKLSDPYAIWWLLRVEEACAAAQAAIAIERAKIQERLSAAPEFEIETGIDEPPLRVELNFACPYAYQAASTLAAFDQFVVGPPTTGSQASREPVKEPFSMRASNPTAVCDTQRLSGAGHHQRRRTVGHTDGTASPCVHGSNSASGSQR